MKSVDQLYKDMVYLLERLMLDGKITIHDIPQEIRCSDRGLYIIGFRVARHNADTLCAILNLLCEDIVTYSNDAQVYDGLMDQFSQYMQSDSWEFPNGLERYKEYEKTVSPEILQRLSDYRGHERGNIKTLLRKYCSEKGIG